MNIVLGDYQDTFGPKPLTIDGAKHTALYGKPGTGKSSLLEYVAWQYISHGFPLILIDPHGDLIDSLESYIPHDRLNDVIHFDPSSDFPIGVNPFNHPDKLLAAQQTNNLISRSWGKDAWGPRSDMIAANVIQALVRAIENPTLVHLGLFFEDDSFANAIFNASGDTYLQRFYDHWKEQRQSDRDVAEAAPYNKVNSFVRNPYVRAVVGQAKGLDFRRIMDERKILLCRLSKGKLGEDETRFVGLMVLASILFAALSREGVPQCRRTLCPVLVDEFHNFTTGDFAEFILSECRKYGVPFIAADQTAKALTPHHFNTLGTARINAEDAEILGPELDLDAQILVELQNFEWAARTVVDGTPITHTFKAKKIHWKPIPENRAKIVERSKRFGKERNFVDFHAAAMPEFRKRRA